MGYRTKTTFYQSSKEFRGLCNLSLTIYHCLLSAKQFSCLHSKKKKKGNTDCGYNPIVAHASSRLA